MDEVPQQVTSPIRALRVASEEHRCSYLPQRRARHEYLFAPSVDPDDYHRLMDMGYRRSGVTIYRPICEGCRQCRPLRVPVDAFRPNRSQRRNRRDNSDLELRIGRPRLTHDRWSLYRRYQHHRHREDGDDSPEALEGFLYTSCVNTTEWRYYLDGRLVMIGIADVCRRSISAVYCYWDPMLAQRGLGVFNVLAHISMAAGEGIPHVYLGYMIRDCRKTAYKAGYAPCELLDGRQVWSSPSPA